MGIPTRKEIDAKKQDINVLYGKISEVESSLKEEKKVNARLRSDLGAKVHQLTSIEKSIVEEQEHYRWTKSDNSSRIVVISGEGEGRIAQMDDLDHSMQVEMAEHDFLEEENERLHARLKELAMEHYQATAAQTEEREQRKQNSFEMRATMEQILRRTLKEVDLEYMMKARAKMDAEADWARQENAKLKKEAVKRQENCASLVRQQQESYEDLVRVKTQKDVVEETALKQEESSHLAALALEEARGTNARLGECVGDFLQEIDMLLAQVDHKKALRKELSGHQAVLARAEAERRRVQRGVVLTCRKSVDRGLKVNEQSRKREGGRLTKGFAIMGDSTSTSAGSSAPPAEESSAEREGDEQSVASLDVRSVRTSDTSFSQHTSMTFLNSEAVALEMQRQEALRREDLDAEATWNSARSDVHVATKLRMEIRKMRQRELRDSLRQEAQMLSKASSGESKGQR